MTRTEYPYAGMILPDAQDMDTAPYLNSAREVLSKYEQGYIPVLNDNGDLMGHSMGVRVSAEEDSDFGPRVLIEIITPNGDHADDSMDEQAAQVLSDTVLAALDHSTADILEWYSPDVLLDVEDFVRLRSYVSPRRQVPDYMQEEPDVDVIANDARLMLFPEADELDFDAPTSSAGAKYPGAKIDTMFDTPAPQKPRGVFAMLSRKLNPFGRKAQAVA